MTAAAARPDVEVVELALPPRPEVVAVVRLVVGSLIDADPSFDEERAADVRLAVSEACTNAIEAQRGGQPIEVRCEVADGWLRLSVTDHGTGFDPADLPAHPAVTDPARLDHESGLGIPLIRLLSDQVDFVVTDAGTTVVMEFEPRLPGGEVLAVPFAVD